MPLPACPPEPAWATRADRERVRRPPPPLPPTIPGCPSGERWIGSSVCGRGCVGELARACGMRAAGTGQRVCVSVHVCVCARQQPTPPQGRTGEGGGRGTTHHSTLPPSPPRNTDVVPIPPACPCLPRQRARLRYPWPATAKRPRGACRRPLGRWDRLSRSFPPTAARALSQWPPAAEPLSSPPLPPASLHPPPLAVASPGSLFFFSSPSLLHHPISIFPPLAPYHFPSVSLSYSFAAISVPVTLSGSITFIRPASSSTPPWPSPVPSPIANPYSPHDAPSVGLARFGRPIARSSTLAALAPRRNTNSSLLETQTWPHPHGSGACNAALDTAPPPPPPTTAVC